MGGPVQDQGFSGKPDHALKYQAAANITFPRLRPLIAESMAIMNVLPAIKTLDHQCPISIECFFYLQGHPRRLEKGETVD